MIRRRFPSLGFLPLALLGCDNRAQAKDAGPGPGAAVAATSGGYVDSAISTAEALRRFRGDLEEIPTSLVRGATTRDALIQGFVRAMEARDTAALRDMVLSRAEFAYLYYPTSKFSRPPYALPPAVLWLLMRENSLKGVRRSLDRRGGQPLGYLGYHCEPQPEPQGENTLWNGCTIRRGVTPEDTITERLFGTIIERDGRYKFVSYANGL